MKLIPFVIFGLFLKADFLKSLPSIAETSVEEKSFEERLEEGYQLLKNEPNAIHTKKLIDELHKMEKTIKDELTLSPEEDADLTNQMKTYLGFKSEHTHLLGETTEEINENSNISVALFQGDMLVTREQAEEIIEDIKQSEGERIKRQAFRDKNYPDTIWKDGMVYYSFYPNATADTIRVFEKAAKVWEKYTCLTFTKDESAVDRIGVFKGIGCYSAVGRTKGVQSLSLSKGCESVGQAVHEIGHALGLYHTQSRHDRSKFVRVLMKNVKDGMAAQFTKQTRSTNKNYGLTYDYGSVMHYGSKIFSKNQQSTIVPRDITYLETLGSLILSYYDILMVNKHYECDKKCDKDSSAKCDNDGFPNPNNCMECICPSGYGGALCDERPEGCGDILYADSAFKTLTDTLGKGGATVADDDFTTCTYWIRAPEGLKVEIVFVSFPQAYAYDGCVFGGVEIKIKDDKRLTGYRFCSPHITTLTSNHSTVPVITFTRFGEVTTVLHYRTSSY